MITVLIPTYNREKFIQDCIRSLMFQTYEDIEILIYDDGSTDNTPNIVKSITDPRIRYIRDRKNRGVSHARNELLNACNTKVACWQDSDDLSNSHRILTQYGFLLKEPFDFFVASKCESFHGVHEPNYSEFPVRHRNSDSYPFPTFMFWLKDAPRFNEQINLGAEDGLWRREMKINCTMIKVPRVLYYVRFHPHRIGMEKKRPENRRAKDRNNKLVQDEIKRIEKIVN